ncbi:hypothetical protein [Sphingomicrobium sediminis]|uniref:Uncharacterized protein n=1 Tax=Sphingomicrobium sediminis TaxID=2950949 RepID=A0A9X2J216_9SPHN|nr:hypothetical protein [Sphingomicrobium sediminis]MCM8556570.1 hypothetical protein [Sphingomicrobium sediminis]
MMKCTDVCNLGIIGLLAVLAPASIIVADPAHAQEPTQSVQAPVSECKIGGIAARSCTDTLHEAAKGKLIVEDINAY